MTSQDMNEPRPFRVTIIYMVEERTRERIRGLCEQLWACGINVFIFSNDMALVESHAAEMQKQIENADAVIICYSVNFEKGVRGYRHQEVRIALEEQRKRPPGNAYLITINLDEGTVPPYLSEARVPNYFRKEHFDGVMRWGLVIRREQLIKTGEKIQEFKYQIPQQEQKTEKTISQRDTADQVERLGVWNVPSKVPEHPHDLHALPDSLSSKMPAQLSLYTKDTSEASVLSRATPVHDTMNQSIKVENFNMTTSQHPVNVFLSYAREDEWLLRQLEAHLSMLKREGLISTWCDRQILPGMNWIGVIDQHLEQATLILFLVSSDFLASDYCYQIEIKRALELHQAGDAIVIPIVVRPTDWKKTPFAQLQALPIDAKAITDWSNQDKAFVDVVSGIRKTVEYLASRPTGPGHAAWPTENKPFVPPSAYTNSSVFQEHNVDPHNTPTSASPTQVPNMYSPHLVADLLALSESDENKQPTQVNLAPHPDATKPSKPPPIARFGAPFPEIWNVVRRHNPFFTGRSHVLDALFDGFGAESEGGMIPPQAITALGGMGKTQTAAEYAYRFRENYQAVLWVRAETLENLLVDFQTIARLLKRPHEHLLDQPGIMQTMREWFLTEEKWLLILDNADDLALVEPFLPLAGRGHILLTTRAGAATRQAQTLRLEALGPDDGALCILRRAGLLAWNEHLQDASEADVDAARQLAELMDGLPLALEQAGAYINDTASGVKRYLNLYGRYRSEIQVVHHGAVPDYPSSVASAWHISRNMVEQSSPAATELLRLCAYLAPEAIPDEILTVGASALGPVLGPVAANPITLDQAIGILRKYSLLNREADRLQADLTRLSIHRIIQEILLDEMDEPTQRLWAERAVCVVAQSLPTMPWPVLQAHAQNCLQLIKQWNMTFPEAELLQQWVEKASARENR